MTLFPTPEGIRTTIFLELLNLNTVFFSFATHFKSSSSTTSRELRQQDEDEVYNGKFMPERVKIMLNFPHFH